MAKKWIKSAIKKPGALRAQAKRAGLIKGDEKMSEADMNKMASHGSSTTKRRVALAKTLRRMKHK